ncbi:MAG: sugar ABC transporter permease, partial [Candidatus Enteromonas sp.]|nr:sugar ABC transporter permease [Candidatus Enteromonas sp.]
TCFVITIAIPQFITLMVVNLLLSDGGPVNTWLEETFHFSIPFLGVIRNGTPLFELDRDASFIKFMIVLINMWVGIPYTMLSTSGILMNIPADLYESAQIDGANPWTQFWKITMPYILFVTGPSLLTTFIGNINNFNVIFFLSNGEPMTADALGNLNAGHTDLLITWLYKLTVSKQNPEYAMGSVIGILVFVVCAFFSLIMYKRMGSVKNEEAFQ